MIGNVYIIRNGWWQGLQITVIGIDGPYFLLKEFGKEDKPGYIHKITLNEINSQLVLDSKATLRNKLIFGSK